MRRNLSVIALCMVSAVWLLGCQHLKRNKDCAPAVSSTVIPPDQCATCTPGQTVPGQVAPGGVAPGGTAPGGVAPVQPAPTPPELPPATSPITTTPPAAAATKKEWPFIPALPVNKIRTDRPAPLPEPDKNLLMLPPTSSPFPEDTDPKPASRPAPAVPAETVPQPPRLPSLTPSSLPPTEGPTSALPSFEPTITPSVGNSPTPVSAPIAIPTLTGTPQVQPAPIAIPTSPTAGPALPTPTYLPPAAALTTASSPRGGTAGDYRALTGQVQQWRGTWRLRYAALDADDPHGGSVTLVGGAELERLRDGQRVRVQGSLLPPEGRNGSARYQVSVVEVVE